MLELEDEVHLSPKWSLIHYQSSGRNEDERSINSSAKGVFTIPMKTQEKVVPEDEVQFTVSVSHQQFPMID